MNNNDLSGKVAKQIARQLDNSADSLDDDIKQRLAYSRQTAVDNAGKRSNFSLWFDRSFAPTFAVASLLIISASIILLPVDNSNVVEESLLISAEHEIEYKTEDDDIVAEYELLNDLEFISWLIDEEYQDESNAG